MIQRIQTIFLLLAALLCIAAIVAPLPYVFSGGTPIDFNDEIALIALNAVVAVVSLGNIFLFRNRPLQSTVCNIAMLLTLLLAVVAAYFAYAKEGSDMPYYGAAFPLLVFLANLLAKRYIIKDEKLVRSADRLR